MGLYKVYGLDPFSVLLKGQDSIYMNGQEKPILLITSKSDLAPFVLVSPELLVEKSDDSCDIEWCILVLS